MHNYCHEKSRKLRNDVSLWVTLSLDIHARADHSIVYGTGLPDVQLIKCHLKVKEPKQKKRSKLLLRFCLSWSETRRYFFGGYNFFSNKEIYIYNIFSKKKKKKTRYGDPPKKWIFERKKNFAHFFCLKYSLYQNFIVMCVEMAEIFEKQTNTKAH